MRILHVMPAVAVRYGGPSVAVRGMARALAARGCDVTIATTDADGAHRLDVPLDTPVIENGVTTRYFARSTPGEWKFSWPMTRWLIDRVRDYDVVHVHALFNYPSLAGCRAAAHAGVPFVIRPLGTLDPWSLRQAGWKKRPYLELIERPHLRRTSAIHVTSEAEAEGVGLLGFGDRARVIELGVELPPPSAEPERRTDDALRLVFLSRLHPGKNVPLLLDALARALRAGADARLDIVGSGPAAYVRELQAIAARLDVTRRVRFLGHLEGSEKTDALLAGDVFVLPSSHENFGIAVAEAMLAGVPVLVSDQVAIAKDVQQAGAGRTLPLDADAWAGAIVAASHNRALAHAMGARARQFATERYSWERTARLLLDLYAELADRQRIVSHPALTTAAVRQLPA